MKFYYVLVCMLFSMTNLYKSYGQDKVTITGDLSSYRQPPKYAILSAYKEQKFEIVSIKNKRFIIDGHFNIKGSLLYARIYLTNNFYKDYKTFIAQEKKKVYLEFILDTTAIKVVFKEPIETSLIYGGALNKENEDWNKIQSSFKKDFEKEHSRENIIRANTNRLLSSLKLAQRYNRSVLTLNQLNFFVHYPMTYEYNQEFTRTLNAFIPDSSTAEKLQEIRDGLQSEIIRRSSKNGLKFPVSQLESATRALPIKDIFVNKKYIVIDFWATWCGPCIAQHGSYIKVMKENATNKAIKFISVSVDKTKASWLNYIKKKPSECDAYWLNATVDKKIADELGIYAVPNYMIVDVSNNKIIKGGIRIDELSQEIKKLK
ncbi:TlpA family protein disulfide reductase [Sphingobacterium siyangense]|nr:MULTISPECIES: thioredoxin family protein [Sphingobacterium]QQT29479.1 thioredoxin family protein [Sphingobacterium multivorum]QRY59677.1 thioredoxin family protein [Sphingobacterium siyangense]